MINAVNSGGSGWSGGLITKSGNPTSVGGQGFGNAGTAAANPTGVPTSGIIEARNNRGSNVRIPYARLVPMHGRGENQAGYGASAADDKTGTNSVYLNGKVALEYDGLRTGELAWVLGRRFKGISNNNEALYEKQLAFGTGVDRMQRLASTDWIIAMFESKLANKAIPLHDIDLSSNLMKSMDANLDTYNPYLAGSTALNVRDITKTLHDLSKDAGAPMPEKSQGIFVAEMGPFLRGIQVDSDAVEVKDAYGMSVYHNVPRNMGDSLAFAGLEAKLRLNNLFDWSPDGIVLSKLESPADDQMTSTALDAQSAQLFNVAIQGPAISTSWTSDVRDSKLECQPLDKCFICLVADLNWASTDNVGDATKARFNAASVTLDDRREDVVNAMKALKAAEKGSPAAAAAKTQLDNAINEANGAAAELANIGNAFQTPREQQAAKDIDDMNQVISSIRADNNLSEAEKLAKTKVETQKLRDAISTREENAKFTNTAQLDAYKTLQGKLRTGESKVVKATLRNFRLIRSTSSHMTNYSHFNPSSPSSRCGLGLGETHGSYIIGAWCIGNVMDSAASRSTIGTLVRTTPTSMALNVNVNIEWWSGDKLYKHYMDSDEHRTNMRGKHERRKAETYADSDVSKRPNSVIRGTQSQEEFARARQAVNDQEPEFARAPGSSALPSRSRQAVRA